MANLLERLPAGSRIAVIRLRSMGDCVLTTPALALLKAHRPDLRIGVVVEDRWRAIFEEIPSVDEILPPLRCAIRAWHPRAILNLHGGTRSMWLTATSGAEIKAGFGHHTYSFLYNAKIPRAQEILGEDRRVHTAEHIASAMFWMGVPRAEIPRARLSAEPSSGAYVVLHPFASTPEKTWPADRVLAVAEHLRDKAALEPVFLAGPHDDASAFAKFRIYQSIPLTQVKSVIAGTQLFIGNDSGPAHIAAAFGIPSVVLFGPSDPVTWAPWKTEARVLTSPASIGSISVAQVISAMEELRVRA